MTAKTTQSTVTSLNILATLVAIIFTILTLLDNDFDYIKPWYIIPIVIVSYLLINWRNVKVLNDEITSRIRNALYIVIEHRRCHLEFLDTQGKKSMYHEELLLKRIVRKKLYEAGLSTSGTIDDNISTYNCYNSLNQAKNEITIVYGKNGTAKARIFNSRQLQFGFALTFHDTFLEEKEYWESRFSHPTKFYDLNISFLKTNPPKNADIYKITNNDDGSEKLEKLPIDPLILYKYDRIVLRIKLLHIKKGDRIRVVWEWNTTKK